MAVTIGVGIADDTPPYRRRRGDRNDVTPPLPVRQSLKVGCRRITAGPPHEEFPALGRLIYQRLAAQSRTTGFLTPKYVDDRRYPGGSQRPLSRTGDSPTPRRYLKCFLTQKTCTARTNSSTRK
jgi:hypothetical protein